MLTRAAAIMAVRSPMRDTSQPLGMSPISSPTRMSAATKPAKGSEAPSVVATTGMIGMIAPSPMREERRGQERRECDRPQAEGGGGRRHDQPTLGRTVLTLVG